MLDAAIVASAALMGLGGAPHCAAMCGAACAAGVGGCAQARAAAGWGALLGGRALGYAAAGAVAAAAVATLGTVAEAAPALRALWTAFHLGALALGLRLLFTGRQPAWLERLGKRRAAAGGGGAWRAGLLGLGWVALPCGLLQSALLLAALANTPLGGAGAMLAFALTSSTGLVLVPALARARLPRRLPPDWPVRAAGTGLAAASAWALGHGLWERVAALCGV